MGEEEEESYSLPHCLHHQYHESSKKVNRTKQKIIG